jgi:hypothetical protein
MAPLPSRFYRLLALAGLVATATPAVGGTFDIKTPEIENGGREVSLNTSFFRGFPVNSDPLRRSVEFGAGYAFTDRWKAGLKVNGDHPAGDDGRVSTVGTEHQLFLGQLTPAITVGWYGALDLRVADDETNTVTTGPVIQFTLAKETTLTLNPFLARSFGRNREPGVTFAYGWQAKTGLREGLAIGIEGYGAVPNLADSPGTDRQEHRVGPLVYLERPIPGRDGLKFSGELGVLFGLTQGTQDVALKVKAGVTW